MVNRLEDRIATRLLATSTSQELADDTTLTPADTSAPTPVIPDQPLESATTTPVTQDPPPPKPAPKDRRHQHQRPATSTLPSTEPTHSYKFKSCSRNIIQFRTDTSHITQLVRNHLLHAKSKPGYDYVDPHGTVVCTSDQDDTCRLIYTKDKKMSDHILLFLRHCREQKVVSFLDEPICRNNPVYDPDTGWD